MAKDPLNTPMMKQFVEMKSKHPDAILLFRVGDFYETYLQDAVTASEILGITLTRRSNGAAAATEMAGFPHHALDTYLPKLVRAGKRVAICDQLEDPKLTKKLVKRGITELVTPGVVVGGTMLDRKENNFLAAVHFGKKMLGVAIESYRPDIVIVDGIADLLADINDGPKAIELISELLRLADKNNCNITVNIHLNRSGEKSNLRGWLGSMLLQKAFEVFNCAKVFKTDVLSVELFMSRKVNESVTFYYKINNQGLPESTEEPDTQQRDENGRFVSQEAQKGRSGLKFNSDYQRDDSDSDKGWSWDLRRLFSDAMQNSAMMGYDDLKTRVMKLGNIIRSSYYETVFAMAEEQGFVKKTQDRNLRVVVVMPPAG